MVYLCPDYLRTKTLRVHTLFFSSKNAMINANTVRELAESHLAGGTGFLVDVRVSDGNAISICWTMTRARALRSAWR